MKYNKIPLDAKSAICNICEKDLDIKKFRLMKKGDYYSYRRTCRDCSYENYSLRNTLPHLRAQRLYSVAKQRFDSTKKYTDFDLTVEWIEKKLEKGECEVSGIKFVFLGKGSHPFSPSIDRIDSSKGYTKENTHLVVWIYNSAKKQFKHEDVIKLDKALIYKDNNASL